MTISCTRPISQDLRKQADGGPSFAQVIADPDKYTGAVVIFGGVIVATHNTKDGTVVEVVHKDLAARKRPKDTDASSGRFLVRTPEYLDPAIYAPERQWTVAGRLTGSEQRPIGEVMYTYPVVVAIEHHLWPERRTDDRPRVGIGFGLGHQF